MGLNLSLNILAIVLAEMGDAPNFNRLNALDDLRKLEAAYNRQPLRKLEAAYNRQRQSVAG